MSASAMAAATAAATDCAPQMPSRSWLMEASISAMAMARSISPAHSTPTGLMRMAAPSECPYALYLPDSGGRNPFRKFREASNSLAPPRLSSSCVATCLSHASTTQSLVGLPLDSIKICAVSMANSVSSVDQLAPLLKSVVKP